LRRAKAKFVGDRRQRRAKEREVDGVENDAAERQDKKGFMPMREGQPLKPGDQLCGFLLGVPGCHPLPLSPAIFGDCSY
jgi:hypothetical protein